MALYSPGKNANIVISRLIYNFLKISEWFSEKYMVPNANKSVFLTLGFNEPFPNFSFNGTTIENVTAEKIIRAVIDNKLIITSHLKNTSKKANPKTQYIFNNNKNLQP